jgi:hypothetical protein
MSNLFAGVYGAKFPEVVMNSGPLPPEGGLPAPLHDTPDARINYGATLLGDLQPYAYGEAGYMSSQSQNNQPHRIQKIIPLLYLPEPKGNDIFPLSHAVDDSDLAFVMRLNRNSIFCTGTRTGTRRNTKIGTTVDPMINLATLNYLLAGLQLGRPDDRQEENLWWEFLYNLDPARWPKEGRNYSVEFEEVTINLDSDESLPADLARIIAKYHGDYSVPVHSPFTLDDIIHVIKHCIKPFGIVRGSEKQGGQHEMGQSPVTWTVPTIATLVIDGKEANVVNIWHYHDLHAGDDVVLRLKLMPVQPYTLNHYFKGFARRSFEVESPCYVWQLVPDVFSMELDPSETVQLPGHFGDKHEEREKNEKSAKAIIAQTDSIGHSKYLSSDEKKARAECLNLIRTRPTIRTRSHKREDVQQIPYEQVFVNPFRSYFTGISWQQLGFWHIGRTQVQRPKFGSCEFYNDDMANNLKTNHIDLTFQPVFSCQPRLPVLSGFVGARGVVSYTFVGKNLKQAEPEWSPQLQLERMDRKPTKKPALSAPASVPTSTVRFAWDTAVSAPGVPPNLSLFDAAPRVTTPYSEACFHAPDLFHGMEKAARVSAIPPYDYTLPPDFFGTADRQPTGRVLESAEELVDLGAPAPLGQLKPGLETGLETGQGPPAAPPDAAPPLASEPSEAAASHGKKPGRSGAKGRKGGEPAGSRGPVDGTLLRPGAEPEACRMELL